MKNIKTKYIGLAAVVCLSLSSCTKDFDALNTNPNAPVESQLGTLAPNVLGDLLKKAGGLDGADLHQRITSLQHDVYSQFNISQGTWGTLQYKPNDGWNQSWWNQHYSWLFRLNGLINNTEGKAEYKNLNAACKIVRVYMQSKITDSFGDSPFPTPEDAKNAVAPYRTVQEQYTEFFAELEKAATSFVLDDEALKGQKFMAADVDLYCQGNAKKWKKFATSLMLRFAVRVQSADAAMAAKYAKSAVALGLISSNAESIRQTTNPQGWGQGYNNVMYQVGWGAPLQLSQSFEHILTGLGGIAFDKDKAKATLGPATADPRAAVYFQAGADKNWRGTIFGFNPDKYNQGDYEVKNMAKMNESTILSTNTRKIDLLLYPEVCFLEAEAILAGLITGDAKAKYEEGIFASFEINGLNANTAAYLASADANALGVSPKWDAAAAADVKLNKIITQKYIALFPDGGLEAWNDRRRTLFPKLQTPANRDPNFWTDDLKSVPVPALTAKAGDFIRRMVLPQGESSLNKEAYQKAYPGNDKPTTPLWWDTNK
ncbi:MAG: SusD/RagB family nutrient-binding outer membrane lipoprotein [Sphingobacteriaceae bacterium]|nr:SusD/RagB family nutrient-binding outer membrane lipoprotein [Sphingobacteriaceae bacterium]